MSADFYLGHRGSALLELTFRYVAGGRRSGSIVASASGRPRQSTGTRAG
jgi:hypothetical protein